MDNGLPTSIVIFGASGDLAQRKLVPSLFNLYRKGRMPKQFRIIGYGNTAFSDDQFRSQLPISDTCKVVIPIWQISRSLAH